MWGQRIQSRDGLLNGLFELRGMLSCIESPYRPHHDHAEIDMPQRIRTPEEIFRSERRDIYTLEFQAKTSAELQKTFKEMQDWFNQNTPDSPTEMLAPSEHSGWIVGGPMSLRIAFTPADLEIFCKRWENTDGGSLDPRFQCSLHPYVDWWEKHGRYMPTLARPEGLGVSVWIETSLGILSHVLPDPEANYHPAKAADLWANACQQWPELKAQSLDDLRYGCVVRTVAPTAPWLLLWNAPYTMLRNLRNDECWRAVADWLRLPADTDIGSEW